MPCVANPPRRAPTGNASDDRIAGPRAPPAISFPAGTYAEPDNYAFGQGTGEAVPLEEYDFGSYNR